jgi:hypothetical protein
MILVSVLKRLTDSFNELESRLRFVQPFIILIFKEGKTYEQQKIGGRYDKVST